MSLWIWMLLAQMATAGATWAAAAWVGPFTAVLVGAGCGASIAVLMTRVVSQRLAGLVRHVQDVSTEAPKTGLPGLDRAFAELRTKFKQCADSEAEGSRQLRELGEALQMSGNGESDPRGVVHKLRRSLSRTSQSVDLELSSLWNAVLEARQCAQSLSKGADQQTETMRSTTVALEQLRSRFAQLGEDPGADAEGSLLDDAQQLAAGVERIRGMAKEGGGRLRSLSDRTRDVNALVQTIGEISARTDLLALNASIESVRAGEHGRGFAMVAEEVRKLAEQTGHAVREVSALVVAAELDVRDIAALLDHQLKHSDEQCRRAAECREALAAAEQRQTASQRWRQSVANVTERQQELAGEMIDSLSQIVDSVEGSRRHSERACWTLETISDTTRQLDSELNTLRAVATGQAASVLDEQRASGTLREPTEPVEPLAPELPGAEGDALQALAPSH